MQGKELLDLCKVKYYIIILNTIPHPSFLRKWHCIFAHNVFASKKISVPL
jgi:hypothetical protein